MKKEIICNKLNDYLRKEFNWHNIDFDMELYLYMDSIKIGRLFLFINKEFKIEIEIRELFALDKISITSISDIIFNRMKKVKIS